MNYFQQLASAEPRPLLEASEGVRIHACMISCQERNAVRAQTLRDLASTDWGSRPVHIQMDKAVVWNRIQRMLHTAYQALLHSRNAAADYVLFLEDDIAFNRWFYHNIVTWEPVKNGQVTFAGLYNQSCRILASDFDRTLIVEPESITGSQAYLLSMPTVRYLLAHWRESREPVDLRMSRLAGRMGQPIYYHRPSLVLHVGTKSVWGGRFIQARDFHRTWKASAPRNAVARIDSAA